MPSVDYLKRLRDLENEIYQDAKDFTDRIDEEAFESGDDSQQKTEKYEQAIEVMRIINAHSVLMHTEMFKKYGMNYHSKFNK